MVRHLSTIPDTSSEDGFSSSSLIDESNDDDEPMEVCNISSVHHGSTNETSSAPLARTKKKQTKRRRRSKHVYPKNIVAMEIKRLQQSTELLIPNAPFLRLLRGVLHKISPTADHVQRLAIAALHEALEAFLVHLMEDSYLLTLHAGRVTLMLPDMRLALALRNRSHYGGGNL
ncbi:histone H3-like centromeric protein A [Trichinella nativa]|uniref:Histone H3-like centromeric protein A n=1 Tax=Trichinella nativa TaxID=6335 RepID=A0A0V1LF81_9BILA|nr:histone H3-like centromeric protein A [Trichinella nativa]